MNLRKDHYRFNFLLLFRKKSQRKTHTCSLQVLVQAFFPQSFLVSSLPHSFGLGAEKFSKKDLFVKVPGLRVSMKH